MSAQKIIPCLWFDGNAGEAMDFYVSVFRNSKIVKAKHCGKEGPGPEGTLLVGYFEIAGQQFMVLNGGPQYKFSEAISFMVNCDTQEEIDELWERLGSGGGAPIACGWIKDKFGVAWQIVPSMMDKFLSDKDPERSGRVLQALWKMTKLDIAELERAANEK